MDSLKRALNRIFKRGKKNKHDQDKAQGHTTGTSSTTKAPQLPPITNASLLQGSSDESDEPVPSRRPLSTGKQPILREVVPQSDESPSAPPAVTAVAEDTSAQTRDSTPLEPTAEKKSTDVDTNPALQTNNPLASVTAKERDAEEDNTIAVAHLNPPPGLSVKSDGVLAEGQTAKEEASKENHAPTINTIEEKVAVASEEPPTIKPARAAPGMSATSGPLEDFPEGG